MSDDSKECKCGTRFEGDGDMCSTCKENEIEMLSKTACREYLRKFDSYIPPMGYTPHNLKEFDLKAWRKEMKSLSGPGHGFDDFPDNGIKVPVEPRFKFDREPMPMGYTPRKLKEFDLKAWRKEMKSLSGPGHGFDD